MAAGQEPGCAYSEPDVARDSAEHDSCGLAPVRSAAQYPGGLQDRIRTHECAGELDERICEGRR